MEPQDFELRPTFGLIGGLTIQFAEGRWTGWQPEEIGEGVALSEDAFDLIEPSLRIACPEWTPMHRYGVFEFPIGAAVSLASLLRIEAKRRSEAACGAGKNVELLQNLSDWLDARQNGGPISILGI